MFKVHETRLMKHSYQMSVMIDRVYYEAFNFNLDFF